VAFGGGISLLALIAISPGWAVPIDFDAPVGCSDAEAFRRGLTARLARTEAPEAGAGLRLRVRLVRVGARVQGELRLVRGPGATDTRRVEGATCDEVVAVLALTAALALEMSEPPATTPTASSTSTATLAAANANANANATVNVTVTPSASPSVASRPAAVAANEPRTARPAASAAALRMGWGLEAGAGGVLARVLGPGVSFGGALMVGVTRRSGRAVAPSLRLALLYLPRDFQAAPGDVAATLSAASLAACPGWGLARGAFQAQACARGVAGWLTATDRGVSNPRSATRGWYSAGAFLRGGAAVGAGFSVELEAGVDALLVQRRFVTTTPLRSVAESPAVSVLVGLGLSRRL
jgi:hypothetical protein